MSAADHGLERRVAEEITRRIGRAGFRVRRVVRVLPPLDTGQPVEVLFLGVKHRDTGPDRPWAARLVPGGDGDPHITAGW